MSELLCPHSADSIARKIQRGECILDKEELAYEGQGNRMGITILFRKALARYSAPSSPMVLLSISNVVSNPVCFCKALERCCAPTDPMLFFPRFRVVNAYVSRRRCL